MNYAQLLIPDFALIFCGFLVCRFTKLNRTVWEQVETLVYFFLFPVLLFHSIVRRPLDFGAFTPFIFAGLTLVASLVLLSFLLMRAPGIGKRDHAAAAQVAFRFNSFIALAVSERIGGAPAVQLMAILMGISVPLCNLAAVWVMTRGTGQQLWRAILSNPLVLATVSGLIANLCGFTIPIWAESTFTRVGQAALALGLLAAGAGLQLNQFRHAPRLSLGVLGIRHGIAPILAALLVILFELEGLQATTLLVFSAMPTASSSYVLAARMGYNGAYVAALVTASTLLGMLSLPFALSSLRYLV